MKKIQIFSLCVLFIFGLTVLAASYFSVEPVFVEDPTGKTEGYLVNPRLGLVELVDSAGIQSNHYYNMKTGFYTFASQKLEESTVAVKSLGFKVKAGIGAGDEPPVDTGTKYCEDNYDLFHEYEKGDSWTATMTTMYVGKAYVPSGPAQGQYEYEAFIGFDTEIEVEIEEDGVSDTSIQVYVTTDQTEDGEGISATVYDESGPPTASNKAREDSQSYSLSPYYQTQSGVIINPTTSAYNSFDTTKANSMLNHWALNRDNDDNYICFRMRGYLVDNGQSDRIYITDSQYTGTSRDPKISFTYQRANENPQADVISDPPSTIYGGKEFTFETRHTDADGAGDINYCYGAIGDASDDIRFRVTGGTGSRTVTTTHGDTYVDSVSCSGETTTNGYDMTWTVTLNWQWDHDESSVIDPFAYTSDDLGASSGWDYKDLNSDYENELIFKSTESNITFDSAVTSNGDALLEEGEWFKGGIQLHARGRVVYEGTTNVYPATTTADVELYADDDWTGTEDETLSATGEYDISFTPVSTDGIDSNYDFDVRLVDLPTGASEGSGGDTGFFNSARDNQNPTVSVTSESESSEYLYADYGTSVQGSYDTGMPLATFTIGGTSSDGTGSGINTLVDNTDFGNNPSNGGSTTTWSFAYAIDSNDNGDVTVTYTATDNVGNTGTATYEFYEISHLTVSFIDPATDFDVNKTAYTILYTHTGYVTDIDIYYDDVLKGAWTNGTVLTDAEALGKNHNMTIVVSNDVEENSATDIFSGWYQRECIVEYNGGNGANWSHPESEGNGGFEYNNFTNWKRDSADQITIAGSAYDGDYCARLDSYSWKTAILYVDFDFNIAVGDGLYISFYCKAASAGATFQLLVGSDWGQTVGTTYTNTTTSWQFYNSTKFYTSTWDEVFFVHNTDEPVIYIDCVIVVVKGYS